MCARLWVTSYKWKVLRKGEMLVLYFCARMRIKNSSTFHGINMCAATFGWTWKFICRAARDMPQCLLLKQLWIQKQTHESDFTDVWVTLMMSRGMNRNMLLVLQKNYELTYDGSFTVSKLGECNPAVHVLFKKQFVTNYNRLKPVLSGTWAPN